MELAARSRAPLPLTIPSRWRTSACRTSSGRAARRRGESSRDALGDGGSGGGPLHWALFVVALDGHESCDVLVAQVEAGGLVPERPAADVCHGRLLHVDSIG